MRPDNADPMLRRWLPAWLSFLAVCAVSITLWTGWSAAGWKGPTGDEPHYLLVARALGSGVLDPSDSYRREFARPEVYPAGLAPPGAALTVGNSHTVESRGGRASIHAPGLPALIALPVALGGVTFARLLLSLIAATIVLALFLFADADRESRNRAAFAAFCLAFAQPVLTGAGQIYPDLAAGVLLLWGLVLASRQDFPASRPAVVAVALCCAGLVWLHLKLVLPAGIVVAYALFRCWRAGAIRHAVLVALVPAVSLALLVVFNLVTFGRVAGPYAGDALVASRQALTTFLGLIADQNHGLLTGHPLALLAGLVVLPVFCRRNPALFGAWVAVMLALLVPNAMHPNWYGGWSFSGRFGWSAAVVLTLPAITGLMLLRPVLLAAAGAASLVYQADLVRALLASDVSLYNKAASTHLFQYPIRFPALAEWLPAFYNADWALAHRPNLLWLLGLAALPALGLVLLQGRWHRRVGGGVIAILAIVFAVKAAQTTVFYGAGRLAAQSGRLVDGVRLAEAGVDAPGFVLFGPYDTFSPGRYEATLMYRFTGGNNLSPGTFEVLDSDANAQLGSVSLPGGDGAQALAIHFSLPPGPGRRLQFRLAWNGQGRLALRGVRVRPARS